MLFFTNSCYDWPPGLCQVACLQFLIYSPYQVCEIRVIISILQTRELRLGEFVICPKVTLIFEARTEPRFIYSETHVLSSKLQCRDKHSNPFLWNQEPGTQQIIMNSLFLYTCLRMEYLVLRFNCKAVWCVSVFFVHLSLISKYS